MFFWIKDFHLKKSSLGKKRWVLFSYYTGYNWKKLKIQLPLSYNADMSFYTNFMLNAIAEDLNKTNSFDEYRKIMPFIEQLNKTLLQNATKLGR